MHFVTEAVPGEITLMFVSYLLFCTVLMYLFVKADREWGRLEVSLDDIGQRDREATIATAMVFSSVQMSQEPMFGEDAMRQSLRNCAQHHQLGCTCFLQDSKRQ